MNSPKAVFIAFLLLIYNGVSSAQSQFSYVGKKIISAIVGKADGDNLYLGMFSYHFHQYARTHENWNNKQIAITYKGFFALGFENSYYSWVYGAGIQRLWFEYPFKNGIDVKLGYRLGFLYGYDGRLSPYAGKHKFLPGILPYLDLQYKRIGIELEYIGVVGTAAFYIKFN
jgi:hypothetical protein